MTKQDLLNFFERPFVWPGGYQLIALMADDEPMCHECVVENKKLISQVDPDCPDDTQWTLTDVFVRWEGPPLICCNCYAEIPSEYGDPDGLKVTVL